MSKDLELETRIAKEEYVSKRELLQLAAPSVFTCPECHGVLLQLKRSGIIPFAVYRSRPPYLYRHPFHGRTVLLDHLATSHGKNRRCAAVRNAPVGNRASRRGRKRGLERQAK